MNFPSDKKSTLLALMPSRGKFEVADTSITETPRCAQGGSSVSTYLGANFVPNFWQIMAFKRSETEVGERVVGYGHQIGSKWR